MIASGVVSIACSEATSPRWSWRWRPMWSVSSRSTSMSCTTTPPHHLPRRLCRCRSRKKSGAKRPGWRSPGATTRTIGPTSSNCSTSSQWPGTARSLCISRSPAATWWTTRPISPPGTCSVAWPDDANFLYVADCKLASHREHGLYPSTPRPVPHRAAPDSSPRTSVFRNLLVQGQVQWRHIHDKRNDKGEIVDQYSVSEPATLSAEGYRLVWYHSTCKAEQDAHTRQQQIERAMNELAELRQKLSSPRHALSPRARSRRQSRRIVQGIAASRAGSSRRSRSETEEKYRQDRSRSTQ